MVQNDLNPDNAVQAAPANTPKPKRVRTGCLTCRERHLKCDEGLPNCQNCKKSNRICKRGLKLNFLDTQVHAPAKLLRADDFYVAFLDESRDIAGEYKGGREQYGAPEEQDQDQSNYKRIRQHNQHQQQQQQHHQSLIDPSLQFDPMQTIPPHAQMSYHELPPIQGILPDASYSDEALAHHLTNAAESYQRHSHTGISPYSNHTAMPQSASYDDGNGTQVNEKRDFLDTPEEVLYMQVFVEEVGLWMDSMDPHKHFSRLLPFASLHEPMLLNAFLACGARHLTLINPIYTEEKALYYYDTATRHLLKSLQNPNRDTVICATTAVILNVYEIMSERALQRMNHIAGARALIKECGWNARATGIGAACFWLNIGLEVLSCLHFNWQVAWDPDNWGVDMEFGRDIEMGREEVWTHRMLYIVAKTCNFRATVPRFQEPDPRDEENRRQQRYNEWQRIKGWADAWNDNIPRTMHPMAFLHASQTTSKSAFPEVWLVKRSNIVARLFYHTVMLLLAQVHPYMPAENQEMWDMQKQHSQMICGIAAHVKDRGVASVALRSLAHAAECLTSRREQEEVLQIFTKINKETGWRIAFVFKELKERWGWKPDDGGGGGGVHITSNADPKVRSVGHIPSISSTSSTGGISPRNTAGIVNPLFAQADFSLPRHPYEAVYVPPAHPGGAMHTSFPSWAAQHHGI